MALQGWQHNTILWAVLPRSAAVFDGAHHRHLPLHTHFQIHYDLFMNLPNCILVLVHVWQVSIMKQSPKEKTCLGDSTQLLCASSELQPERALGNASLGENISKKGNDVIPQEGDPADVSSENSDSSSRKCCLPADPPLLPAHPLSSSSAARDAAKEKEFISLGRRADPVSADTQAEGTELQIQ